jgi:ParB/RepB/Spo0J family partition protein
MSVPSVPPAIVSPAKPTAPKLLPITKIVPGSNDRTVFKREQLEELAASIRDHGLLQPISVRPHGDGYEIIAGERRFRAVQLIPWEKVPAFILDVNDADASALMLAENTARVDLDPMDEARAYEVRVRVLKLSEEEVAKQAGVSGSRVRSRLKLCRLMTTVQTLVRSGQLPLSYAEMVADAGLSETNQLVALQTFSGKERPSASWFRLVVAELAEKQHQSAMFDELDFVAKMTEEPEADKSIDPKSLPRPLKSAPPRKPESDPRSELEFQRDFWLDAQKKWTAVKSTWYSTECEIAARALETVIAVMQPKVQQEAIVLS